jgi:hypothetical protein
MVIYETLTILRKLKQEDSHIKKVYTELTTSKDITILKRLNFIKRH